MGPKLYEEMLDRAMEFGRKRDYSSSAVLLEQILSETDTLPIALLYLGRSYHALGEYGRAVPILLAFTRAEPDNEAGYFFLGRSYLAAGLYNHAVKCFKEALSINPESGMCILYIGYAYLKCGNTESALDFFGKAVELRPGDTRLYAGYLNSLFIQGIKEFQKGNLELSRDMLVFYRDKGGDNLLLHLYLGLLERELGFPDRALEHYNRAVAMNPDDSSIRFQRAEVLFMAGMGDEALAEIEELSVDADFEMTGRDIDSIQRILAVKMFQDAQYRRAVHFAVKILKNNQDPDMHLLIGESYRHLGDFEKAGNHYRIARKILQHSVEPLYGLAVLCWESGDWQGMLDMCNKITLLKPRDPISSYYTALCLARLSHPVEETIPRLRKEIEKSGPDPYLFTALGREYLRSEKDSDQGEQWLRKALELKPDMRDAFAGLIDYYGAVGDDAELLRVLDDFLERFPSETETGRLRIQVLLRNELYERAVPALETYLAAHPDDTGSKRALAFCLRETKQFSPASVWYRRLLLQEPENEAYLRSLVYCLKAGKRTKEARDILEKALAYYKKPSSTLFAILSGLYYSEDLLDDAIRTAHLALDAFSDNCIVMKNLALMYRKKGIEEFAERYERKAEKCFKKNSCDR